MKSFLLYFLLLSILLINACESSDSENQDADFLAGHYYPTMTGTQKIYYGFDNIDDEFRYIEESYAGYFPYIDDEYSLEYSIMYNSDRTTVLDEDYRLIKVSNGQVLEDSINHLLPYNRHNINTWKPIISFRNIDISEQGVIIDSVFMAFNYDPETDQFTTSIEDQLVQLVSPDTSIVTALGTLENCIVLKAIHRIYGDVSTGITYTFAPGIGKIGFKKDEYDDYTHTLETVYEYQVVDHSSINNTSIPEIPQIASITNNQNNVSLSPPLSWSCRDTDNDDLRYNVYLSEKTTHIVPLIHTSLSDTVYPAALQLLPNTRYFLQIAAYDLKGGLTFSENITFVTIN